MNCPLSQVPVLFSGGRFQAQAINLCVNYDGKGLAFADQSLRATSSDVVSVSVHAARAQDGPLTLVVISRSERPQACLMDVKGAQFSNAELYRVAGTDPQVKSAGVLAVSPGGTIEFPAMSATTVVLR